jgi:hypothetical protein
VLGGMTTLIRAAVLFADYARLDVVPAHGVHGAFAGIEDECQSRGSDETRPKEMATYVIWRHIAGSVFSSREDECWRGWWGRKCCCEVGGYIDRGAEPRMTLFGMVFGDEMA